VRALAVLASGREACSIPLHEFLCQKICIKFTVAHPLHANLCKTRSKIVATKFKNVKHDVKLCKLFTHYSVCMNPCSDRKICKFVQISFKLCSYVHKPLHNFFTNVGKPSPKCLFGNCFGYLASDYRAGLTSHSWASKAIAEYGLKKTHRMIFIGQCYQTFIVSVMPNQPTFPLADFSRSNGTYSILLGWYWDSLDTYL